MPDKTGGEMLRVIIGFFVGTFFGYFLLGLMQMIREGDKYEEHLLEQRRKDNQGQFRESSHNAVHSWPHHRRGVCPFCGSKLGEVGDLDHGVLYNEHGSLGIQKGAGD
jgi:hypothetical protein